MAEWLLQFTKDRLWNPGRATLAYTSISLIVVAFLLASLVVIIIWDGYDWEGLLLILFTMCALGLGLLLRLIAMLPWGSVRRASVMLASAVIGWTIVTIFLDPMFERGWIRSLFAPSAPRFPLEAIYWTILIGSVLIVEAILLLGWNPGRR